ncbi:MAG: hypothetical protein IPG59_09650 [Candidatus Melainabacteria bacterium]|nr:MAG: hypothetical protein IPG59_09650 [Candidatus Melainabacteria bacterium]
MANLKFACEAVSILALATSLCVPLQAKATTTQIYDGRVDRKLRKISEAESKAVEAAVTPSAKRKWEKSCEQAFEIKSVCDGAFTKAGSKQSAFLYSFCETGHALGMGGIAIMEKGKLVAHFAYEAGGEYDIARLADLDGDGMDDIAIVAGSTNQGYTISGIAIIGINSNAVKKFGRFEIYNDNSGAVEKNAQTFTWSFTSDIPSKSPTFLQQKFKQVGKNWVKSGSSTKAIPEKDEVNYEVLSAK